MRYFVTGATGFIGGTLVRQLLAEGHDVVALVRSPEKAAALETDGVTLAPGDLSDPVSIRQAMAGCDGVFHLAAWYQIGGDTSAAHRINVEGTRHVLEAMRALGIPRGVYTSTLAINSDTRGHVRDETYRHEGPFLSAYEQTKWQAHYEIALPLARAGLPLVIVMPGIVYGPGDTSQMGALLRDVYADTRVPLPTGNTACWSHVEDTARAHVLAMEKGVPGETYIISGPCHPWREVFETVARLGGHDLHVLPVPSALLSGLAKVSGLVETVVPLPGIASAEALRSSAGVTFLGDNSKAKRDLGYAPRPLEVGLRDTFAAPS